MDALALLNALDIIRNEEKYQERLNTLAEAKAKLDTSQYIVETVEIAQARFDEANRLLADYRKLLAGGKEEIEKERGERLKEIIEREEILREREKVLERSYEEFDRRERNLKFQQEAFKTQQQALAQRNLDFDKMNKEAQEIKALYSQKIEQLRKIIGV